MRCKGRASRTFTVGGGWVARASPGRLATHLKRRLPAGGGGGLRHGLHPRLAAEDARVQTAGGAPVQRGLCNLVGRRPPRRPSLFPGGPPAPPPPSPPPSPLSLRVALSPPAPHLCPRTPCGWAAVVPRADAFGCVRLDSSDVARVGWLLFSACCLSQRMRVTSTHSLAPSSDLALRKITRMREVFAESCVCICTY